MLLLLFLQVTIKHLQQMLMSSQKQIQLVAKTDKVLATDAIAKKINLEVSSELYFLNSDLQ